MKIIYGLFSPLMACLAVILYFVGSVDRTMAFVDKYEDTPYKDRAAFADAYRRSWVIDKWTITSGACVCASIGFGVAAFKRPKKGPAEKP
jgi:hypothetical protein